MSREVAPGIQLLRLGNKWFLRTRPYTDIDPKPAQVLTRYNFARMATTAFDETMEEGGVNPPRAKVAKLKGARYRARRRESHRGRPRRPKRPGRPPL